MQNVDLLNKFSDQSILIHPLTVDKPDIKRSRLK